MFRFGKGKAPKTLVELWQANMSRPDPTPAPAVTMPAAAETHARPIGTTGPLRPVRSGVN